MNNEPGLPIYKLVFTEDLIEVADRWLTVDTSEDSAENFACFIGISPKSLSEVRSLTLALTPEQGNRMFLLAGPNYHTVIKAWLSRRSKDVKENRDDNS